MKAKKLFLSLVIASTMILASCTNQKQPADDKQQVENKQDDTKPIKIGTIQPMSGPLAVSGHDSQTGTEIAVAMFNEQGGVNGRLIELVSADVPDAAAAQNEMNRLIQNEKIKVVTGVYGSAIAEVAGGISNRNDVLYWEQISILDKLTEQGYKSVFRMHVNASAFGLQASKIAEHYAGKIGVDIKDLKVAVVCTNGDAGMATVKQVKDYAAQAGFTVVLEELYDPNSPDSSPVVLKMKAAKPDVVISFSYINDGVDIIKKSKTLDFSPKLYIGLGSGYGLDVFSESLGKDTEGIIDMDPTVTPVIANLSPEMGKLTEEFQKRFKEKRGYDSPAIGYLTWQSTWVLLNEVVAKAGGVDDFEKLLAAAKAVDLPVGYLPTGAGVKFDEKGQNERAVLAAMQWQGGKLVTIYPEFLKTADEIMMPLPEWKDR